jgi:hypothetical protein
MIFLVGIGGLIGGATTLLTPVVNRSYCIDKLIRKVMKIKDSYIIKIKRIFYL